MKKNPAFVFLVIIFAALILVSGCKKKSDEPAITTPSVTTKTPASITDTTAVSGGFISSEGGSSVTERGICYGKNQNPSVADLTIKEGSGTGTFQCTVTGLDRGTKYYVRAYGINSAGIGYGNQVSFTTSYTPPTVTTTSVTNITMFSATCGGQVTSQGSLPVLARGLCWDTTGNPTLVHCIGKTKNGSGTGAFNSNLTGLNLGTTYYIIAYAANEMDTTYGTEVKQFETLGCGNSFTVTHKAGAVAPVTKTVTYGTVTNIPGEPSKCWITSNLGASRQATAKDDDTEASAGWYWQFNRKQGYKHDGTTRTPNTAWITSIDENADWQTANDPCALEIGSGWHIPTITEWTNVNENGNWTNWNGPWDSELKLHAAGYLNYSVGSLISRGSLGFYWSSTQFDATNGWYLFFYWGYSYMYSDLKANGFSARCVRD
jgi:hypothetical protein